MLRADDNYLRRDLAWTLERGQALRMRERRSQDMFLLAEFRNDLLTEPPGSLSLVSQPTKDQLKLALEVAELLRHKHAESYVELADL